MRLLSPLPGRGPSSRWLVIPMWWLSTRPVANSLHTDMTQEPLCFLFSGIRVTVSC